MTVKAHFTHLRRRKTYSSTSTIHITLQCCTRTVLVYTVYTGTVYTVVYIVYSAVLCDCVCYRATLTCYLHTCTVAQQRKSIVYSGTVRYPGSAVVYYILYPFPWILQSEIQTWNVFTRPKVLEQDCLLCPTRVYIPIKSYFT